MSTIPVSLTQEQFEQYIRPYLSVAKRGYECRIPLYKIFNYILYRLHTGCQWERLPIDNIPQQSPKKEISYHAIYHHFRKWSRDGSLERVFEHSILTIRDQIDSHRLNLDGSHAPAKKGGEAVAYQGRKKAKTSNVLPISDANGFILATTTMPLNSRIIYALPSNSSSGSVLPLLGATSMQIRLLTPKLPAKFASITNSFPTSRKTSVPARRPNADASAYSTATSTSCASPVSGPLLGLTSFAPCWFALTAKPLISWAHISSFTPSSISVTYWLRKSLNEFIATITRPIHRA